MKAIPKICQSTPLLPVLVGILTVTSMFAANAGRLGWGQLWVPIVFVLSWSMVCWLIFWLFPKGRSFSGLLGAIAVLVTMLWTVFPELPLKGMLGYQIIPFLVWAAGSIYYIRYHDRVNKVLPMVTAVVLIAVLITLGQSAFGIIGRSGGNEAVASQESTQTDSDCPDIYFIIPDRFCSPEGLREAGLDVSEFVGELRDRGFYVRENAVSGDTYMPGDRAPQTTRTLRYLASVLNFGVDIDINIGYNEAGNMVQNPEVIRVLHSMGYACYNIGSWYPETAVNHAADYNYVYIASNPIQRLYTQEFGAAVLDRSLWRYFVLTGNQTERDRQMFQLESVKKIADDNGVSPKFVFAHILLPHPPFVWTADGQPQECVDCNDMEKYLEQVQFTESYLLEMIGSIPQDAIVIIQSDEGICFTKSSENDVLSFGQWEGIFTAWRIPGVDNDELDDVGHTQILDFVVELVRRQGNE